MRWPTRSSGRPGTRRTRPALRPGRGGPRRCGSGPRDLSQLGGVDVGREREHAGGLHEPAAEAARRLAGQQAREADAAALRGLPLEVLGPAGEELGEDGQVGGDDRPVAGADPLPVLRAIVARCSLGPALQIDV